MGYRMIYLLQVDELGMSGMHEGKGWAGASHKMVRVYWKEKATQGSHRTRDGHSVEDSYRQCGCEAVAQIEVGDLEIVIM